MERQPHVADGGAKILDRVHSTPYRDNMSRSDVDSSATLLQTTRLPAVFEADGLGQIRTSFPKVAPAWLDAVLLAP